MAKYFAKRLMYMVIMMIAITVMSFFIMELPPGDYLTTYISNLESKGEDVDSAEVERLKMVYGYDQPLVIRFFKWVAGFPRGDFGYSLSKGKPVLEAVAPCFKVSLLIAVIVFFTTTAIQLYMGYESALHKNKAIDYIFSTLGVLGRSIPAFVLALLALLLVFKITGGKSYAGLYSREFVNAPMSWDKFVDGFKHLLLPICVVTFSQMSFKGVRANMLDEINRPYVTTARAKGMKETKLLIKYPFRMSIIPNMGAIGLAIPGLISGETIAGIVLNLPTMGPLMLSALKAQDMYLAGAILLFQSAMTLVGVLISDLALAAIDPRVRLDG